MTPRPLLVTGPARSGTTLVARVLDAHPAVGLAVDPLLPAVRALRDALARRSSDARVRAMVDAGSPLQDYHYRPERIAMLDAVWSGSLDVPITPPEAAALRPALAARAAIEAPGLVGALTALEVPDHRALWEGAFAAVAGGRDLAWAGSKEVWAVELVPAMARAWPEARFVLVRRDPRAIVASNLAMGRTDPSQVAHPLSVARHWRRQEAMLARMAGEGLGGRVHVVAYERLLADPPGETAAMAAFLGLAPDPAMLDVGALRGSDGAAWAANTSHGPVAPGLRPELAERWRASLEPAVVALVELAAGPDMAAAGYSPDTPHEGGRPGPEVLARLAADDRVAWSWRSDLGDPVADLGADLARRRMLAWPAEGDDPDAVRSAFLFPEALAALRAARP